MHVVHVFLLFKQNDKKNKLVKWYVQAQKLSIDNTNVYGYISDENIQKIGETINTKNSLLVQPN